jgi:hypothetical protein
LPQVLPHLPPGVATNTGEDTMPWSLELWRGRQWVVSAGGIRPHDGNDYEIETGRLGEETRRLGVALSDWLLHMAEKSWVDIDDFIAAWCVAIAIHRTALGEIDVARSIREAREERTHGPG